MEEVKRLMEEVDVKSREQTDKLDKKMQVHRGQRGTLDW
jgi:hypothetical protein